MKNTTLLASLFVSLFLAVTSSALAGYVPSQSQTPPGGKTTSSGSRGGCNGSQETPLFVLAPQEHLGQTVSTHPTFVWFVPDSEPHAMEFRLYEYNSNGKRQIKEKIELQSKQGIMKLSLPKDRSGLSVKQRYLWQVIVFCDRNHPSSALVAEAEIKVVEMSPTLSTKLASTTDSLERAHLFAKSSLWYDALGEVIEHKDLKTKKFQLALLKHIGKSEDLEKLENWLSSN